MKGVAIMKITRPALRYHGGKWKLAPWIIGHIPPHKVYTEVYGGGASVLLRKQRTHTEVYNDLDGEVVNVFRVLRNPSQARELVRLLTLTPYSREEYEGSYLLDGDPIEMARRTVVRSFMGFGNVATTANSGFRSGSRLSGASAAADWARLPQALEAIVERMRGVTVEHRPAIDVLRQYDNAAALHYVDPPYLKSTRNSSASGGNVYRHEMTDDEHVELATVLHELDGAVILSGYASPLYAELYADWRTVTRSAHADSGAERTEVLWLSPHCLNQQPQLFVTEPQP